MIKKQARFEEMAARAADMAQVVYTRFLDPAEMAEATHAAKRAGVTLAQWGGIEDAERQMAAFVPQGMEDAINWPMICVKMQWNARYGTPAHRDLLGAWMGLGIGREQMGDIALSEGEAYAFATREMADYVADRLTEAGRVSLRCEVLAHMPHVAQAEGRRMYDTVPSLRLDAVVAAAFLLSRGEAQEIIREGRVRVDHLPQEKVDAPLHEGSLVSVRGMGRARIQEVGAVNRKGRIGITLERFG